MCVCVCVCVCVYIYKSSLKPDTHRSRLGPRASAGSLMREAPRAVHTSAYISIRQHTSAYVRIRQHTSAYVIAREAA